MLVVKNPDFKTSRAGLEEVVQTTLPRKLQDKIENKSKNVKRKLFLGSKRIYDF